MKRLLAALLLCACLGYPAQADTLTGWVYLRLQSDLIPSTGFGAAREKVDHLISRQWSSGTGTYSVDVAYTSKADISAGASVTLDLVGGVTDSLGRAVTFGHVKALAVENLGSTTLTLGSGTAPILFLGHATDTVAIHASGALLLVSPGTGYLATSTTAENLHIEAAAGGTGSYLLWVVGTSD